MEKEDQGRKKRIKDGGWKEGGWMKSERKGGTYIWCRVNFVY